MKEHELHILQLKEIIEDRESFCTGHLDADEIMIKDINALFYAIHAIENQHTGIIRSLINSFKNLIRTDDGYSNSLVGEWNNSDTINPNDPSFKCQYSLKCRYYRTQKCSDCEFASAKIDCYRKKVYPR